MSFLRTVIADARPRKPVPGPSNSPSLINGWKTRGLGGNDYQADQNSSAVVDQTRLSSVSSPVRDRTSENILGTESNVEPESLTSAPLDLGRATPNEEGYSQMDIGKLLDRVPVSEGDKLPKVEGSLTPQLADIVIQDGLTNPPTSQISDFLIEFQDTRGLQNQTKGNEEIKPVNSPESITDTPTIQTDTTQNTKLTSPKSSHRIESGTLEASLVPVVPSGDQKRDTAAATGPIGTLADGDFQQPGQFRVDDAPSRESEYTFRPDNPAQWNKAGEPLADGGKADKVSPVVDKQTDIERMSNREEIARNQISDETKGVAQDVQPVSHKRDDFAPQKIKDLEHAPVLQTADRKVSNSTGSPNFAPTKPGSHELPVARTEKPSIPFEAPRSVPAMPFQTDSMLKTGDNLRSKPQLRYAKKPPQAPKVQIGQIDVIIEAAVQPVSKPAASSLPNDMASRYYLRRL